MIKFTSNDHTYQSIDPSDTREWISVTSLVSLFKPPFNAAEKSLKASKNPKSKWYGMDPDLIRSTWTSESKRSVEAGTWYHNKREQEVLNHGPYYREGIALNVLPPLSDGPVKIAPIQKLSNNSVYPEHMAFSMTDSICGQSDRVEVVNHKVNITDYKTVKALQLQGYTDWEGITRKMLAPLNHLDDCHLVHYTLQLSLYMYMILRHNPQFTPGTLVIEHIIFELESTDEYGFPIYKRDDKGEFIVKEVKPYKVPYMKTEIYSMIEHFRTNKEKVLQHLKKK